MVLEGVLMEVYLDDLLIECYSLPAPATGRVGLIPGGQRNSIGAPEAWKQSPSGNATEPQVPCCAAASPP